MLAAIDVWLSSLFDNQLKCDTFFEFSIILYNEVLEIIESDIDILICILHIFGQLTHQ